MRHPPLPDLVKDSQLQAAFRADTTVHRLIKTGSNGRRVRYEERWKIEKHLGQGSYGRVWKETCLTKSDEENPRLRAVKMILKPEGKSKSIDYNRELEAIAKFSHAKYESCFVRSFGWYESRDAIFIAMEFMGHGDLQKYMPEPGQYFPLEDTQDVIAQVLEGLFHMHENGFAHRDLKPANILVKSKPPEDEKWWVKIGDFGISKRAENQSGPSTIKGTYGFMAPELLSVMHSSRRAETSFAPQPTDIWALGEIAFRMLCGLPTFDDIFELVRWTENPTLEMLDPLKKVANEEAFDLIQSCLQVDPDKRISAKDALSHPWVKEHLPYDASDPISPSTELHLPQYPHSEEVFGGTEPSAKWSTLSEYITVQKTVQQDGCTRKDIDSSQPLSVPVSNNPVAVVTESNRVDLTIRPSKDLLSDEDPVQRGRTPDLGVARRLSESSGDEELHNMRNNLPPISPETTNPTVDLFADPLHVFTHFNDSKLGFYCGSRQARTNPDDAKAIEITKRRERERLRQRKARHKEIAADLKYSYDKAHSDAPEEPEPALPKPDHQYARTAHASSTIDRDTTFSSSPFEGTGDADGQDDIDSRDGGSTKAKLGKSHRQPNRQMKQQKFSKEEVALLAGIPEGYALKHWDGEEEWITVLGSAFDYNSLGKWIFGWSSVSGGSDHAKNLWLLLIRFSGTKRLCEEYLKESTRLQIPGQHTPHFNLMLSWLDGGQELGKRLKSLIKSGETYMWSQHDKGNGSSFVDSLFGPTRDLYETGAWMAAAGAWVNKVAFRDGILEELDTDAMKRRREKTILQKKEALDYMSMVAAANQTRRVGRQGSPYDFATGENNELPGSREDELSAKQRKEKTKHMQDEAIRYMDAARREEAAPFRYESHAPEPRNPSTTHPETIVTRSGPAKVVLHAPNSEAREECAREFGWDRRSREEREHNYGHKVKKASDEDEDSRPQTSRRKKKSKNTGQGESKPTAIRYATKYSPEDIRWSPSGLRDRDDDEAPRNGRVKTYIY